MESEVPAQFFAARGFELRFFEADGFVWADLQSISDTSFKHRKYGRGLDEASAAARTVERWRSEQGISGRDVLRMVASDPHGGVGEEVLHELGFNGSESAVASAIARGWIEIDSEGVHRVTNEGQQALDASS